MLDLEGVNFVDSQGSAKLTEIHELTQADGVELRLAGVKPQVRAVLDADGVVERIGADHIHGNVHTALEAQLAEAERASEPLPIAADPGARPTSRTPARRVAGRDGARQSRAPPPTEERDHEQSSRVSTARTASKPTRRARLRRGVDDVVGRWCWRCTRWWARGVVREARRRAPVTRR